MLGKRIWIVSAIVVACGSLLAGIVATGSPVAAADSCPAEARALDLRLLRLPQSQQTQQVMQPIIAEARSARPDCSAAFDRLIEYFQANGAEKFPFPQSSDPPKAFLGPVGWWWNVIYVSLFSRNILLMWLFGWELFLIPVLFSLTIVLTVLTSIVTSPFASKRQ